MNKLKFKVFHNGTEWPLRDENGILWIVEAGISLLTQNTQEVIRQDIETRILPQAKAVYEATPDELAAYIEKECASAAREMARAVNAANSLNKSGEFDRTNVIHYIFNKERAKALRAFLDECRNTCGKAGGLAPELQEPRAQAILDKAVKVGLIKDDYSPTDKLRTKALRAYFAMKFSEATGWKDASGKPQHRYAPFERLWGDKGLGMIMYNKRAYNGKVQGAGVLDAFFTNIKH